MEQINPTAISVISILILLVIVLYLMPIGLWFSALVSGVRISFTELLLMKFRRSPVTEIVKSLIMSHKGGFPLNRDQLEAHALSGGNVENVAIGMVAAHQAGVKLSFEKATAADFKGINLLEAVRAEVAKRKETESLFE